MKIQVTKEDIQLGRKGTSKRNPVALALRRFTGIDDVHISDLTYAIPQLKIYKNLPDKAIKWLYNFNYGAERPTPFEFEIDIPQQD